MVSNGPVRVAPARHRSVMMGAVRPLGGELPVVDAMLDPFIAPVVDAMRAASFRTVASCDGGIAHSETNPYVALLPDGGGCDATRHRLIEWLTEVGLDGCYVDVRFPVGGGEALAPFLAVQWWTRAPIKRWHELESQRRRLASTAAT